MYKVYFENRYGVKATPMFIEAKNRKEASKIGSKKSRLSDFPEEWKIKIVAL